MKTLRQMCAAATLSLVLAASALAGQIHSPGYVPPPPPPPPSEETTSSSLTTIILTIISLVAVR